MNYVKSCLIITMLLGIGYSQCDANGDGDLDVLDVVIEVDCILTDCWEGGSDTTDVCVDIDGNVYETVLIGEQLWMAENLKVTHYSDGSEIPNITNNGDWGSLTTGAYGYYDDDPAHQVTYGNLYNWYTVDDSRGVCPEGWHVPSDNDYTILTDYLGGLNVAGGKMKEIGLDHWNSPNDGATNESGFTGLPGGARGSSSGSYQNMGNYGSFWSSSEYEGNDAWTRILNYDNSNGSRYIGSERIGFSIRCLGD